MCRQLATPLACANYEWWRAEPCAHAHDGQITRGRQLFNEQRGSYHPPFHTPSRSTTFIVLTAIHARAQGSSTDQFDPISAIFSVQENTAKEVRYFRICTSPPPRFEPKKLSQCLQSFIIISRVLTCLHCLVPVIFVVQLSDAICQTAVPPWAPVSSLGFPDNVIEGKDMLGMIMLDMNHGVKKMSPGHKQLYSVIIRGCQPRNAE